MSYTRGLHLGPFDVGGLEPSQQPPLGRVEALAVVSSVMTRVILSTSYLKIIDSGGVQLELRNKKQDTV